FALWGSKMPEIEKIGHASMKIKVEGKNIYVDPFCTDSLPEKVKEFYDRAEKADILLITHGHHDHCDPSTFQKLLKEDTEIAAPEVCSDKIDEGFTTVNPGDVIELKGITIRVVPAYNQKRKRESGEPFHPKGDGVGYVIRAEEKNIYHPGDTEYIPEMEELGEVHTAFLPIDGTYTMDIDEAVEAAKTIRPTIVVPIHERDADPNEFKNKLEKEIDIEVKLM
ncbi:MAG: MBL fold metallo-hydrolase, partial [Candidatus Aenigmatarchaeota archaeon]